MKILVRLAIDDPHRAIVGQIENVAGFLVLPAQADPQLGLVETDALRAQQACLGIENRFVILVRGLVGHRDAGMKWLARFLAYLVGDEVGHGLVEISFNLAPSPTGQDEMAVCHRIDRPYARTCCRLVSRAGADRRHLTL